MEGHSNSDLLAMEGRKTGAAVNTVEGLLMGQEDCRSLCLIEEESTASSTTQREAEGQLHGRHMTGGERGGTRPRGAKRGEEKHGQQPTWWTERKLVSG